MNAKDAKEFFTFAAITSPLASINQITTPGLPISMAMGVAGGYIGCHIAKPDRCHYATAGTVVGVLGGMILAATLAPAWDAAENQQTTPTKNNPIIQSHHTHAPPALALKFK